MSRITLSCVPNRGIPTSCMPPHLISLRTPAPQACSVYDHSRSKDNIIWLPFPPFVQVTVIEAPRSSMGKPGRSRNEHSPCVSVQHQLIASCVARTPYNSRYSRCFVPLQTCFGGKLQVANHAIVYIWALPYFTEGNARPSSLLRQL